MGTNLTSTELESAAGMQDWRVLARGVAAWFETDSMSSGADLAGAILALGQGTSEVAVAVRRSGVRVTLRGEGGFGAAVLDAARQISAQAAAAGLRAEPSALSDAQVTIDVADVETVRPFWTSALGYDQVGTEDLVDPLRRNPPIWFQDLQEARPLRNRIHLDAIRTALGEAAVREELVSLSGSSGYGGAFGVALADREGNEVDLVPPGDDWADRPELADWVLLFAAMAHYPVGSPGAAADVVRQAASLADRAGVELLIDATRAEVTFDSGKDGWEMDDRFADLAVEVQAAARGLGLVADPEPLRFLQLGIDAADIDAVRDFWRAVLGYVDDSRRELGVTDLYDPLRLGPVVFFQDLEADPARRAQRNRIHVDLYVPADQAQTRIDAALAAGGRVVRDAEAPFWVTLADPEGNEIDIAVIAGREERWPS